ncbi:beach-domain-containing protein [Xylona heveae TC161]|uniref:Beach-domain-containing protein n=1 Tax=Xylona heveae (strain CBS 132557 / TC161) TaxID=1328760 RepID=A0A165H658_XYLHT|nr:beach-domain-containing protein [Xylona heveae TC161]KZF23043.1 beach-domain-containing protein [Xylona heveae TC161]
MTSVASRHRSSTAVSASASIAPVIAELRPAVEALNTDSREHVHPSVTDLRTKIDKIRQVRQQLRKVAYPGQAQDAFRHLHGFEAVLEAIRSLSGFYDTQKLSNTQRTDFFELLDEALRTLSDALEHHWGNRRYFRNKVGGWASLEQVLASTGIGGTTDIEHVLADQGKIFAVLLAFAFGDDTPKKYFESIFNLRGPFETGAQELADNEASGSDEKVGPRRSNYRSVVEEQAKDFFGAFTSIQNPEMVAIVLNFWLAFPRAPRETQEPNITSLALVAALRWIAESSFHNLAALHSTRILSSIIPHLFDKSLHPVEADTLRSLAVTLAGLGVNKLQDSQFLFKNAIHSPEVAEFLLQSVRVSRAPPLIHFDLSLHGHSSVELPDLGRNFPPISPSAGYTFTAWLRVDTFDSESHTTVFGAFDTSQTCFVLIYLEKDTRNLILQTSIRSTRPSVRFKSTIFEQGVWYHIAVVHRRPRSASSSRASLYVNGKFTEQVRSHYPCIPPALNTSTESFASLTSSSRHNPVQVFLGTPQDLSSNIGRGLVSSKWSLASSHLFNDALSDDLIAVYYQLGPRYSGNFQDCLGSFQTYDASAKLNMLNESRHPGKEDRSDIVAAIRSKASTLLPESQILFNISPVAVLCGDQNHLNKPQIIAGLSKQAGRSLQQLTRAGGNPIVINGAIPAINDALTLSNGVAILTGEPAVVIPESLDNDSWRLSGCCSVGLKLIENAATPSDLLLAVRIFFETVKDNWRNSEAVERENGFGILGAILRGKLGGGMTMGSANPVTFDTDDSTTHERLSSGLLSLILDFVGYDRTDPSESIINNPLAYRVLLVDLDLWRKTGCDTQKLYYNQFVTFGVQSKYRHFNLKRLSRMRIVKKLLEAMKTSTFPSAVTEDFLAAFKFLVSSCLSAEVLRSLALFITYALHKSESITPRTWTRKATMPLRQNSTKRTLRTASSHGSLSQSAQPSAPTETQDLSRMQLGIRILEVYADLLCNEDGTVLIKKFARTVTNKWLLFLLAEDEPRVVLLGAKILSRLLTIHGASYVKKFADKSGGFVIMRHRLKRWWNIPTIWPICFALLFNHDVGKIEFGRSFDLYSLLDIFGPNTQVIYPEVLPVITSMIQRGVKEIVQDSGSSATAPQNVSSANETMLTHTGMNVEHARRPSMDYNTELSSSRKPFDFNVDRRAIILHTVIHFLADIHNKSPSFRQFAANSNYIQEMLFVLYPVIVSSDTVSAETELNSRGSALTFDGGDVVIRPISRIESQPSPIVRTMNVTSPPSPNLQRAYPLRRGSSFVLVTSHQKQHSPSSARLNPVMSPKTSQSITLNVSNTIVESLMELVTAVFMEQVLERKEFPGFGLFLRVPPGFQEHQAYFESYILRNTLSQLNNHLQLNRSLLWEPRVINNLYRLSAHLGEAVFEGWFLSGAEPLLEFAGTVLEYLQRPDVGQTKGVRLCSQAIGGIRAVFLRVVLLRLSELDDTDSEEEVVSFLDKMMYWQTIILSPENTEGDFLRLICYLLYTKLIRDEENIRLSAANLWRILLVQKPNETSLVFNQATTADQKYLSSGFRKLTELDNETFISWVDNHREDLDAFFFGAMSKSWECFVQDENRRTEETAKTRISRRRERLRMWISEELADDDILHKHGIARNHWMANIYASEHLKHQRALQDQQDDFAFLTSTFNRLDRDLRRPCGLLDAGNAQKWQLDQTEGRNRMRLRLVPDTSNYQQDFRPKRKQSTMTLRARPRADSETPIDISGSRSKSLTPTSPGTPTLNGRRARAFSELSQGQEDGDEAFEIIDDPKDEDGGYEDKNRKVMRSLQRGDQVQLVYNVSRIVGLEACEGLLIIGKNYLYLLDNFFQRSDGEIVNAWQAPNEERDPYLQMISGRNPGENRPRNTRDHESRDWNWSDVISISKRRFLFRDVAIEVFFRDGRSYLLTTVSLSLRDEVYSKLISRAPHVIGNAPSPHPEDSWRIEALKSPEDVPQTLGSKFANVFASNSYLPATRKWMKGEISNFHYLMLVNTMAGRTFNDLTQYPVFPWILADYTSEELDLNNPRSFRDLSKPMGAQSAEREAEFRDRYASFAEMGDQDSPAFHYGTHYSSAMIVTSYLIRLPPFVQSYLLLQGGNFDHADRLFYSIERAWSSASRDNMTDVRELIPEFFYLPEFLTNPNKFDLGLRQGSNEPINLVALPPWAKGDPKIFIAKHREALESSYVSEHLHQWIDLVFGFKQQGEAALEATNVFHHLSYRGAKDLDNIEDPLERLATIGIIHNFGQTPHQVFRKPHPQREDLSRQPKKLEATAASLTRLPFPLLAESNERVASLLFSPKHDRLLCSAAFRLNVPPNYDRYMEWGFSDESVRFFSTDSKKLIGLFEHLHQGQLSCAQFADSRTLITAGMDCTISVWLVISGSRSVDLQPKVTLFGHRAPVNVLAASRSFSALLSASSDGQVILWNLNRLEFVRKLATGKHVDCARINDVTGQILLCSGQHASLYTLNGELMLEQKVCESDDDDILSCAFYEGNGSEWLEKNLIFTGHRWGVAKVWEVTIRNGKFVLDLVKQLNHVDANNEDGFNISAAITAILPMSQAVYAGDEDGRVYEWDIVQRQESYLGR